MLPVIYIIDYFLLNALIYRLLIPKNIILQPNKKKVNLQEDIRDVIIYPNTNPKVAQRRDVANKKALFLKVPYAST